MKTKIKKKKKFIYLIRRPSELWNVIVDVTDSYRNRHASGFGLFRHRFFGRDGAIGGRQLFIIQTEKSFDPDAKNSLVDHHAGTDVKQVVETLQCQVESPVFALNNAADNAKIVVGNKTEKNKTRC